MLKFIELYIEKGKKSILQYNCFFKAHLLYARRYVIWGKNNELNEIRSEYKHKVTMAQKYLIYDNWKVKTANVIGN